jgi:hypothetical protein
MQGSLATVSFASLTEDFVSNPYVVVAGGQEVIFSLSTGLWRRLDEGVNVLSDFVPGTSLLYTNNNNSCGLHGCIGGSIGGGGGGPVDILFSSGVVTVGLQAETQVLGRETFTISAYNDLMQLGTFDISGITGQRQDGSALFLGVAATDGDVITRVHITSTVMQNNFVFRDDFFFGPLTFQWVPEPGSGILSLVAFVTGAIAIVRHRSAAANPLAPYPK